MHGLKQNGMEYKVSYFMSIVTSMPSIIKLKVYIVARKCVVWFSDTCISQIQNE